jgi:hypothetical protein
MWPKLTVALIHRHMPYSDKTAKGHVKGQQQGIRSTKQRALEKIIRKEETRIKIEGEASPYRPLPPSKLNDIFVRVEDLFEEVHTNQTVAFPHMSQRGNQYIMVAVHLNVNYIFAMPMKNRTEGEMVRAYQRVINRMHAAGLGIKKLVLNNECSVAMKECRKHNNIEYKLVPPGQHRQNQAKRAIQTFKAHFISILAGVNNKFPLSLWYHLLEPTKLTLNLLHQSRVAPNISAFAHVHNMHDYMHKPFAPIGCTIQPHKSQKWNYKIKLLQFVQVILSTVQFNRTQKHLFDLVIQFIFVQVIKILYFDLLQKYYQKLNFKIRIYFYDVQ